VRKEDPDSNPRQGREYYQKVIDIGANDGVDTLPMAQEMGSSGDV
jgi:hypothetical protein